MILTDYRRDKAKDEGGSEVPKLFLNCFVFKGKFLFLLESFKKEKDAVNDYRRNKSKDEQSPLHGL